MKRKIKSHFKISMKIFEIKNSKNSILSKFYSVKNNARLNS